jgi:ABC-type antimicrobial peptide transport system permease subunit
LDKPRLPIRPSSFPTPSRATLPAPNDIKDDFFSIRDTGDVELATKQILKVIQSRHQPTSVYTAQTLTELLNTAALIANALTLVLLLVSSVTLAVGGIGIMNIMLANVRSRIREIGIRKALGATYREIKLQFLIEAVFISLSGGVIGTILGLAVPYSVRLFHLVPHSDLRTVRDYRVAAATWWASSLARFPPPAPRSWIRSSH